MRTLIILKILQDLELTKNSEKFENFNFPHFERKLLFQSQLARTRVHSEQICSQNQKHMKFNYNLEGKITTKNGQVGSPLQ